MASMFARRYLLVSLSLLGGLYTFVQVQIVDLFDPSHHLLSSFRPGPVIDPNDLNARIPQLDPATHILPGELPGYTGWARPAKTLVDEFALEDAPEVSVNRRVWKTRVTCGHPDCANGGSLFDLRAYGPAIIPGRTKDFRNGTYEFQFYFFDEGTYFVEAVLGFSNPTPIQKFPILEEESYEGYMLPDFPLFVTVENDPENPPPPDKTNRICKTDNFVDSHHTTAVTAGRWKFQERYRDVEVDGGITWNPGYRSGFNSWGYRMEFIRPECHLPPFEQMFENRKWKKAKHLVLVGDSNIRLQYINLRAMALKFKDFFENFRMSVVSTSDGLDQKMDDIRNDVKTIIDEHDPDKEDMVVVMNAGLHDVSRLCSMMYMKRQLEAGFEVPPCGGVYADYLQQAVDVIKTLPADTFIWESTSSGWAKWGNYGFQWQPDLKQALPLYPQPCEYFNALARPIVEKAGFVPVDLFWRTYARPEHHEIGPTNHAGKHMVHGGVEIYSLVLREIFTILLEQYEGY